MSKQLISGAAIGAFALATTMFASAQAAPISTAISTFTPSSGGLVEQVRNMGGGGFGGGGGGRSFGGGGFSGGRSFGGGSFSGGRSFGGGSFSGGRSFSGNVSRGYSGGSRGMTSRSFNGSPRMVTPRGNRVSSVPPAGQFRSSMNGRSRTAHNNPRRPVRWSRDHRHRFFGPYFIVPFGYGLYASNSCYDWEYGPHGWGYYWDYAECPV